MKISKKKYNIFIYISLLLLFIFFGDILILNYLKKNINSENRIENIEKLESAENLIFKKITDNKERLTSSQRFIRLLTDQNNFFTIDSLNVVKISAKRKDEKYKKTFYIPHIKFNNSIFKNFSDFSDKILYLNNTYAEIWQKYGTYFIRIASSKPNIKDYIFIPENDEVAKLFLTKTAVFEKINSEFDINYSLSFPVYQNGKTVFFVTLENNENILSQINTLLINKNEKFLVANKNGKIIFGKNKADNIPDLLNIHKYSIVDFKSPEILKFNTETLLIKYIPEQEIYIGLILNNKKNNTVFVKSEQIVFLISFIIAVIIILFFILYNSRQRKKEQEILKGIKDILPQENVSFKTFYETSNFLKKYLTEIKKIVQKIADGDYEGAKIIDAPKDEIFSTLYEINNIFIQIKQKEIENQKELELKASLDKTALQISEILQYATDLDNLSYKIIKHIAEFAGAEQIAMFVIKEDLNKNKSMQMTASYAYSKQRTAHKELAVDEGLTGRVFLEKKTIFLTEIPDNYTFIESGFGFQKPNYLLIIPLIFNNNVQAILELGSINLIKDYQIKFIEQTGENIASTIANLKHSRQTEMLLNQTREQSEQIENQRKTLEEKINTHRKQNRNLDKEILQLIEIIDSIKSVSYLIEYDLKGNIIDVSNKMINSFDAGKGFFISKSHKDIIVNEKYNEIYRNFWDDLASNKIHYIEEILKAENKEVVFKQTYVPIRNVRRKIYRILSIGIVKE
ncbi:MAG: GAF domain-containing protein [Chlorobi bacterium]|nr:GAF domain-containing protein [Chlorobiota bacterium]